MPLDDGVYRPGVDRPSLIPVAEEENEESRESRELMRLEDVFPGLKTASALDVLLAPIDGFLGVTALANEANAEATSGQYYHLMAQIKGIDPTFIDYELLPPGSIEGLPWEGRNNLINGLKMQRAVTYYRMRGDVNPLQVETLRFLKKAVDKAYAEGAKKFAAGELEAKLGREEAIGNFIDPLVRRQLKQLFNTYKVDYGPGGEITVNNRDYDTSKPEKPYTVPDARIRDVSFDWTLTRKTIAFPQIRGFFNADSRIRAVVIVRPSEVGEDDVYLIPRSALSAPRR